VKHAARLGLLVLLGALGAFEALFLAERSRGDEALAAERSLRSARATELLRDELVRELDVAEARVEALETLPLLEEDGLLWLRDGVQHVPRVAGVLDAGDAAVTWLELDGGLSAERLFRAWPRLERRQAAELCVRLQRQNPKDAALTGLCQRGLAGTVVPVPALTPEVVTLFSTPDGKHWLAVQRDGAVRGAELDLAQTQKRVTELLHRRAVLDAQDDVALVDAQPLPALELKSPRLDEARRALVSAFWLKTSLLLVTALLGVAVVVLMRVAEARERQSLELQREFIATVSHELRTPLAGIRVLAETLERKLGAEPAARDYPKRLVAAVDGLGFLVENILSFNRIEAGRVQLKKEPFAVSALEPMLRDDVALMVERPVQLAFEGLGALGSVSADVTLLRVLVLNLLRNTWKYARPDNPTPHFSVTGRAEASGVVLTFTDDGPGIAADAHERVFEPFHRQPEAESSNVRGSGLGLALSRRIAALHGGALRISASSARGTTFELTLPR
jgi:signal transduction histidine kinase